MTTAIEMDHDLVDAAGEVIPILFADSNGDVSKLMNALLNESANKDKAYSLLLALMRSGLLSVEDAATVLGRFTTKESKERVIQLGRAYITTTLSDENAVAFMEIVKEKAPELLGEIIAAKQGWTRRNIREQVMKHLYTKELWIALAAMTEDVAKRK